MFLQIAAILLAAVMVILVINTTYLGELYLINEKNKIKSVTDYLSTLDLQSGIYLGTVSKIEKEKNERHEVLEVLQNIPKQPTTKNEYNIYPQPNSQNFYGADMKGVQIRALSPSAIPQNQKLMNHKRENNNEQKNK